MKYESFKVGDVVEGAEDQSGLYIRAGVKYVIVAVHKNGYDAEPYSLVVTKLDSGERVAGKYGMHWASRFKQVNLKELV